MTALPAPPEGLIVPDPADPRHLRRVLPAALDAAGVVLPPGVPGGDPAAARAGLGLPEVARVCVVLVDGLGAHNLDARGGHAPYLRRRSHDEASLRLTTCAPSTTAAAITTFGTGALPGATGMVGYEARDPARGTAMSLIAWEDTTLTPRSVQTVPTLAERAAERSPGARRPVSIGPARFVGSGLTEAALRGWEPRTAESLPQRVDATVAALREPAVAVTYLYWGDLDHAGHEHGWTSDAWVAELEHLDAELGRLARIVDVLAHLAAAGLAIGLEHVLQLAQQIGVRAEMAEMAVARGFLLFHLLAHFHAVELMEGISLDDLRGELFAAEDVLEAAHHRGGAGARRPGDGNDGMFDRHGASLFSIQGNQCMQRPS